MKISMTPVLKVLTIFLFVNCFYTLSYAQENQQEPGEHAEAKNFIAFFTGNTTIVQSGFHLPTIGVEYVREITPKFGLGIITEYELGSHIVQKNESGQVMAEVEREGALLILPSAFVEVYQGLALSAGYGVEFEKNENLGLLKIGLEYSLKLQNPNWRVVPSVSWDTTQFFDGVVYGFMVGYKF